MKKTFVSNAQKFVVCITIITVLLIYGCRKDSFSLTQLSKDEPISTKQVTITVDEVEKWFNETAVVKSSLNGNDRPVFSRINPEWRNAQNGFSTTGQEFFFAPVNLSFDKAALSKLLVTRKPDGTLTGSYVIYVPDASYHRSVNGEYTVASYSGFRLGFDLNGYFTAGSKIANGNYTTDSISIRSESSRGGIQIRSWEPMVICWELTAFVTDIGCSTVYIETNNYTTPSPPSSNSSGGGGGYGGGEPTNVFDDAKLRLLRQEYIRDLGITDEEWNFLKDFPRALGAFDSYLTNKGRDRANARAIKSYLPDFYGQDDAAANHFGLLKTDAEYYSQNKNAGFPKIGSSAWANTLKFDDERLNPAELALAILYPVQALQIQVNSQTATAETIRRYGSNGRDDVSDAFRHAYWNALNASDTFVFVAKQFADAHESGVNTNDPNAVLARDMDFWNNDQGRTIGGDNSAASDEDLSILVFGAIDRGLMRYICNGILIPTNRRC